MVQNVRILIQPWEGEKAYRAYSPFGVRDFPELADAKAYATNTACRLARRRAHQAGASRVKVHTKQDDRIVQVGSEQLFIETEVIATAVGRPRLKE